MFLSTDLMKSIYRQKNIEIVTLWIDFITELTLIQICA